VSSSILVPLKKARRCDRARRLLQVDGEPGAAVIVDAVCASLSPVRVFEELLQVPDFDSFVAAAGNEELIVAADCQAADRAQVAPEFVDFLGGIAAGIP
jgi:hypothetical protein